jgi:hypothetical protein
MCNSIIAFLYISAANQSDFSMALLNTFFACLQTKLSAMLPPFFLLTNALLYNQTYFAGEGKCDLQN